MTRSQQIEALVQKWRIPLTEFSGNDFFLTPNESRLKCANELEAALALPDDGGGSRLRLHRKMKRQSCYSATALMTMMCRM
jgi:hypothetical protein